MKFPNLHNIIESIPYELHIIPKGWKERPTHQRFERCYQHKSGVLVICSIDTMEDGTKWKHISCSKNRKNPSWTEVYGVKRVFIGDDAEAIQVFPKHKDLIDLTDCLHIWSPVL